MHKTKINGISLGFTLVELIVVIVILAILATIAFLSFGNQSSTARDSTRMADMGNIAKGLGVNQTIGGKYSLPDKNVKISSTTGTLIGYQGEAGSSTLNIIRFSADGGKDPLDKTYYTYSTNTVQNKYQLLAFLENNNIAFNYNPFGNIDKTFSFDYASRYPYEKGDEMGIVLSKSIGTGGSTGATVYTPLQDIVALQGSSTGFVILDPTVNTGMVAVKSDSTSVPVTISNLIGFTTPINPVPTTGNVSYKWTKTLGGTANDSGLAITTDSVGNIIVVGTYQNTVDFNPEAGVDSKLGWGIGTFISKYGPDGSYIRTKTMLGQNTYGFSVATDNSDNIYVTGYFNGTVDFGSGDSKTSSGSTGSDIFVTRINSDWSYGGTKTFGGLNWDTGNSLAIDNDGNIYITGNFSGTANFNTDGGSDVKTSSGGTNSDIFITKINSNWSYGWTKTMGGTSGDSGNGMDIDAAGNIFVTGHFKGTANFNTDGGSDIKSSVVGTTSDIFITKLNSNGSYGWTKTVGGASDDTGRELKADSNGNILIDGNFKGSVNFNTDGGSDIKTSDGGSEDAFIMKINSNGSYGWTKTVGGASADNSYGIETDVNGNVFVTGNYKGPVNFNTDGGSDIRESNGGSSDIFLTKINSNGSYGWTKTMGSPSSDNGYGIAATPNNDIFLVGYFLGTTNFDTDGGSDIREVNGGTDVFFTKFN